MGTTEHAVGISKGGGFPRSCQPRDLGQQLASRQEENGPPGTRLEKVDAVALKEE